MASAFASLRKPISLVHLSNVSIGSRVLWEGRYGHGSNNLGGSRLCNKKKKRKKEQLVWVFNQVPQPPQDGGQLPFWNLFLSERFTYSSDLADVDTAQATICDVAVDPSYQNRGIGRKIVKELVKNMKKREGPTGFAVFPPPRTRLFFWTLGFRPDRKFRFMVYRGRRLIEEELNTEVEDQIGFE